MKLDIIVPHYKEPWEVGKPLFDSIELQRMVNLADVNVILVNDGEGYEIDNSNFFGYSQHYSFNIHQITIPHGGISMARNAGFDYSNGDWVMYCDFDDSFLSLLALHMIFREMETDKYDLIWSCFMEETKCGNGEMRVTAHERDMIFIHGKAYRRKFLVDNNLRFYDALAIHEDVYLNMLAQSICPEERIGGIETPIYLWKWYDKSVTRKDNSEDFILLTFDCLVRQRIALTNEFIKRKMHQNAQMVVVKTVIDTYYDCQKELWKAKENKDLLTRAESWISAYLKRYAKYYATADIKVIAMMMKASRDNAIKTGFYAEEQTLGQWLTHLARDITPVDPVELNV